MLVVRFRRIERAQLRDLRHDRPREGLRVRELLDVRIGLLFDGIVLELAEVTVAHPKPGGQPLDPQTGSTAQFAKHLSESHRPEYAMG